MLRSVQEMAWAEKAGRVRGFPPLSPGAVPSPYYVSCIGGRCVARRGLLFGAAFDAGQEESEAHKVLPVLPSAATRCACDVNCDGR